MNQNFQNKGSKCEYKGWLEKEPLFFSPPLLWKIIECETFKDGGKQGEITLMKSWFKGTPSFLIKKSILHITYTVCKQQAQPKVVYWHFFPSTLH